MVDEVRRRRMAITGIPLLTPFESANDFKQYLSLSMTTTEAAVEKDDSDDDAEKSKKDADKKKKEKQTA
jgi:hypothetical protein